VPDSVRFTAVWAAAVLLASACGDSSSPSATLPPNDQGWWRNAVGYEIFVRSFADSDGDGIGDLKGITARLDALNDGNPVTATDLGVNLLWLMPPFPSPSYHGYDVTDYRAVNPQYGTLADLEALVQAAHRRGIRVVLDMVLNHSSSQHPWFTGAAQGPSAPRRDWYVWSATDPGWASPFGGSPWRAGNSAYYYGIFASSMPDLNLGNASVEQELVDSMKFWLARGLDGFRLDAVRYYVATGPSVLQQMDQPETHAFLRRIRAALQAAYPQALLVAEAWADVDTVATYYGKGDEVQLAFAFDQADAIRSSVAKGSSDDLVNSLARTEAALAGKDRGFDAPFLSNHDQVRVARSLGGDVAAARLGAAAMMAMPGTPFLYYGEEIGMQGGASSDDRDKRTPYRWDATPPGYGFTTSATTWYGPTAEAAGVDLASQRADGASLWNAYRRLVAVRVGSAALTGTGAARATVSGGGPGAFALLRSASSQRVLFVANFATTPSGSFTVDAAGSPGSVLESQGLTGTPSAAGGKIAIAGLAARGYAFIQLN
jgi:glycosidase